MLLYLTDITQESKSKPFSGKETKAHCFEKKWKKRKLGNEVENKWVWACLSQITNQGELKQHEAVE